MASITVYTAVAVVTEPVTMDDLEKFLFEKQWLRTWKERWSNGVVRYDYVSFEIAEPIELDMVPGEDGNVTQLRVLARTEGVLETFQEVIAGMVESFEIHRADIGIIRRAS